MFQTSHYEIHVLLVLLSACFLSELEVNFVRQVGGTLYVQAVIMIDYLYKSFVVIGLAIDQLLVLEGLAGVIACLMDIVDGPHEHGWLGCVHSLLG